MSHRTHCVYARRGSMRCMGIARKGPQRPAVRPAAFQRRCEHRGPGIPPICRDVLVNPMSFRCCEPNLRRRNDECEGGASGMRAACRVPGMAFTAWHDARAAWHVAYSAWHVAYSAWHRGMVRGIAAWFAASRGGTTPAAWAALSARALVRRRDRRVVLIADTQGRARLRHASPGSRHRGMVRDITELLHAGSRHRGMVRGIARCCSTTWA